MAATGFILLISADIERGERLRDVLRDRTSHSCRLVTSIDEALESIRQRAPDLVVADVGLNGQATPRVAQLLDSTARDATLLSVGEAPSSLRTKHVSLSLLPDKADVAELAPAIDRLAAEAASRRADRLMQQSLSEHQSEVFEGIVGASKPMQHIIARIQKAAKNKLTVLILGETGVGKELIARAVHNRSNRSNKPFLALNCAGLTESLLESHLFGHVRGAFTGADRDRKGFFEAADGGTLFLDEIGDMPYTMQAKLLRTLQTREITPVGSTEIRRVDVRFIAATNVDLQEKVRENGFREDLFYRLNDYQIRVPPLRERREDIPLLAVHLLREANREHGQDVPGFTSEALERLTRYHWPGNVRQLESAVNVAVNEAEDRLIEVDDLPEDVRGRNELAPISPSMVGLTMAQVERLMIERTLRSTDGNREQAAKLLGIGERTLYRKLKEYSIN